MDSKMNRRDFLKRLGAVALAASPLTSLGSLTSCKTGDSRAQHLTILHTNDVHSHIDPFPKNDQLYGGLGGYARRQAFIDKMRASRGADNTMVLEAGDMFQGTPYFNFYKGMLEMQLMNRMHIDAVTIGNHEFDNGVSALCDCIETANFPFISTNYIFADNRAADLILPYKTFDRGGIRVGVFGLGVQLKGLVSSMNCAGVTYEDPIACAQETSTMLKHKGCDLVIALSHVGYKMDSQPDDIEIAQNTSDLDIIIGGHTHTFMPCPDYITNRIGRKVLVNQVGFGGINVGILDISLDGSRKTVFNAASQEKMG